MKNEDVEIKTYRNQPTILIGLGETGNKIVDEILGGVFKSIDVLAYAIGDDANDLQVLSNIPVDNRLSLIMSGKEDTTLCTINEAEKWLPKDRLLLNKTLTEGVYQVRDISRVIFETVCKSGKFNTLLDDTIHMAKKCVASNQKMRISILTRLGGGICSGFFIEIALFFRSEITKRFPQLNLEIQGDFVLPECFGATSSHERADLQANAYIALKNLTAINESLMCNGTSGKLHYYSEQIPDFVEHIPFDYCFLYDEGISAPEENYNVSMAVYERLFGNSANIVNEEFVKRLIGSSSKHPDNIYGKFNYIKVNRIEDVIDQIRLFISQTDINNGEYFCVVSSPTPLKLSDFLQDEIKNNVSIIENVDSRLSEFGIVEFSCGDIEKIMNILNGKEEENAESKLIAETDNAEYLQ